MERSFLRLRRERVLRGWSQTDLTVWTRIPQSNLSLIERGLVPVHPEWRRRLAKVFTLPEDVLFAVDDEPAVAERVG